jgi:hypothetical protein
VGQEGTEPQNDRSARSPSTLLAGLSLDGPDRPHGLDAGAAGHGPGSPSSPPSRVRRAPRRLRFLRALGRGEFVPVDAAGWPTAGWSPREIMTKNLRRGDVFVWRLQLQMVARTVLLDSGMYSIMTRGAYSDPDAPQTSELVAHEFFPRELFLVLARGVSIDAWQD